LINFEPFLVLSVNSVHQWTHGICERQITLLLIEKCLFKKDLLLMLNDFIIIRIYLYCFDLFCNCCKNSIQKNISVDRFLHQI
jgi:hypothetical protein